MITMRHSLFFLLSLLFVMGGVAQTTGQSRDWRNIANGSSIYANGYIDQPYVVVLPDGSWLCVFTTGSGTESTPGQHIVATRSHDKGKTWSTPVDIEPSSGPSASWATPYLTSFGRVYVFYDYNGDHVQTLDGKPIRHNSEMGWYCYKYSDDQGATWSERFRLPMPKAPVDYHNDFKGSVQLFWGIDKPIRFGDHQMIFAFTRLGKYVQSDGEGWFYRSPNIDVEKDAHKLQWDLLPKGEVGIRNPAYGSIQEEFNTVPLNNGDLFCMLRTTMGFSANSYSQDGGETWTMPIAATYTPGGTQLLKNPRACPRVFKCSNGKYLFWFHNQGSKGYQGRNPVWISGGIEKNGKLYWSQPEILLYDTDLKVNGMSYPDLIEQDGQFWFTETQKTTARVHPVDRSLLEGMWTQADNQSAYKQGILFHQQTDKPGQSYALKGLPGLKDGGFTLDLWLSVPDNRPDLTLVEALDEEGKGFSLSTTGKQSLRLTLTDGRTISSWESDSAALSPNQLHHVAFVVDGISGIISVVIDDKLCDGGKYRDYGWGRIDPALNRLSNDNTLSLHTGPGLKSVTIYDHYLTTSQCIGNYRAGIAGSQ